MKTVSLELVPREENALREELTLVKKYSDRINVINIPDLLRLPLRSWEGAAIAKEFFPRVIPHIRAMDIDLSQPLPMREFLRQHDITEVLVVEGDPPQDMHHAVYPTVTTDVIAKFRAEMPEVTVYAGIDQYRSSMRHEFIRVQRKKQAGAVGFFTQPFFDVRLMAIYADMLAGLNVYWGVSPVTSPMSKCYWERKNNAVFPQNFTPTLEWSNNFAKQAADFAEQNNGNIYFMPIKVDLQTYLSGVLS